MSVIAKVRKRDGRLEPFTPQKIEVAISKAIRAVGTVNSRLAQALADQAVKLLESHWRGRIPGVENIQDIVEAVLVKNNLTEIAKAYILYRQKRTELRQVKEFFGVRDDLKLGINAIKVLERRYLLRDEKGRVKETPSHMFRRTAKVAAKAEKKYGASAKKVREWENIFYQMMTKLEFLPNTPTLMNAATPLNQLSACFVLPIEDSLDSIFDALKTTAKIHQSGGGTGFSFSSLRPKGDMVRTTGGVASGPVSFMKIYDATTSTIKQGGRRRGANMGVLRVDHPDILEFITSKSDPKALQNFNISVAVTDKFMKCAEVNRDYRLINPRTNKIVKKIKAREVFDLIVSHAWQSGDPGIIFIDEINRKNPTKRLGKIEATNPCGEVPLHPYESCNLGSINLVKIIEGEPLRGKINWKKLKQLVRQAVRFLDNIIDANKYPLPEIKEIALANRRIGLGIMGFAEALILLGIPYNSKEALRAGAKIMRFISREGRQISKELAFERGSFPNFKNSVWPERGLKRLRNATVTTIAPTGTISIIAGCSSGIEPLFAVSYVRNVMEGARLLESNVFFEDVAKKQKFWSTDLLRKVSENGSLRNVSGIPPSIKRVFMTALDIFPQWHLKMQAVFQKWTDNAVSKTINLPEDASIDDVRRACLLAWKLKCKGITVYRYNSKSEQVLNIGSLEPLVAERHVSAESEYAGGCLAGVCAYATS